MQGNILSFTVQDGQGLISGDDGIVTLSREPSGEKTLLPTLVSVSTSSRRAHRRWPFTGLWARE